MTTISEEEFNQRREYSHKKVAAQSRVKDMLFDRAAGWQRVEAVSTHDRANLMWEQGETYKQARARAQVRVAWFEARRRGSTLQRQFLYPLPERRS